MKYEEDIKTEKAKVKINEQLNDAILAIKQMDDTKLADRLLYDLSLCHIGSGYLNYRKKFLNPLSITNTQVAKRLDRLDFIGYLLADKLDQNNLIQNIVNNICVGKDIKTFSEIDELQQNVKIIVRQTFAELIQDYKNQREQNLELPNNNSDSSIGSSLSSGDKSESPKFKI